MFLLLHGWGANSATFTELSTKLQPNYRVIALDLPGFGNTQAPKTAWGIEDYSRFVSDFLKKIEVKQLYGLVGHSFGGRIALYIAGNHVIDIQKLILLDAHGLPESGSLRRGLYKIVAKLGRLATYPLPPTKRQKLRQKLYAKAGAQDYLANPHLKETFKRVIEQDATDYAKNISQPTLLIYGSEDKTTPPELGKRLSELILHSKFEIIEGAGHYAYLDKPVEVWQKIEGFLGDD